MPKNIDLNAFKERLFKLYDGREAAFAAIDKDFAAMSQRWNQDSGTMGRILRAHLFVEHYLTQYLQARNPNLGNVNDARLSFSQKISLIGNGEKSIAYLVPGIKVLNKVRNRLAHTLLAQVTQQDAKELLKINLFREFRKASVKPRRPIDDPLVVLEDFAKHAGNMLFAAANPDNGKWVEAVRAAVPALSRK